ncbi:MAG: exo-alpha-sialidase [Myxococcota bacterium]
MFDPRREFIFGDVRPFAQCHASTLCEVGAGEILAAWFGGSREGQPDVGIWAATRRASPPAGSASPSPTAPAWTAPACIAKVSDEPHWNPVLYVLSALSEPQQGPAREIALQFKVGKSIRSWVTWLQRSNDGGQTWSKAKPLGPRDRGGRGAVRNAPIQLQSGDWLAGASTETWRRWDAFFDRSANGIDHWQATPNVALDRSNFQGKGLIQPTLWESSPEQVHALFRTTDGSVYRSDSADDGRSFGAAYATSLPNNNSGLDLARFGENRLALVCNPVEGNWAERSPLSLLISEDNGVTWPTRLDLETEPGEFSYPAIIPTEASAGIAAPEKNGAKGGGLALTYTWNRRRIAFLHIPESEIPG